MIGNSEDRDLLRQISKEIDSLINKEFEKAGVDRAYFRFKLLVEVLSQEFSKISEEILMEDDRNFCVFCEKPTEFYDKSRDMHLCANCFADINRKK